MESNIDAETSHTGKLNKRSYKRSAEDEPIKLINITRGGEDGGTLSGNKEWDNAFQGRGSVASQPSKIVRLGSMGVSSLMLSVKTVSKTNFVL